MKNQQSLENPQFILLDPNRKFGQEYLIRYSTIAIISLLSAWLQLDFHYGEGGLWIAFLISFIRTALIWNGSMLIIQYSVNRFSMFKEMFKLIVFQIFTLIFYVLLVEVGEIISVEYFLKISLTRPEKAALVIVSLIITFMISAIYASVSFFIQWKENLIRSQILEKANLEAKYDTLRNQVNPHFLFNSLNTLLMLVNDNPVASRYVESISEIMRYMLQSRDKEAVLLRDELKIAQEYIFIQQNRFGDKLHVEFDIPELYYHYAMPPLAIQMLLENAIKHNVVSKENQLFVRVYIAENAYVAVENSLKPKTDREPSTGVGLENIRNRYVYLSGKSILVKQENNKFIVQLPLFEKSI